MRRIYMLKCHFASVPDELMEEFKKYKKEALLKWIKKEIYNDYHIDIKIKEDIDIFRNLLIKDYYENISEWVKEKMRNYLILQKQDKNINFYIEHMTNSGTPLFLSYDSINSQIAQEGMYKWVSNFNLAQMFSSYDAAIKCFKNNFSNKIEYEIKKYYVD